MQCKSPKDFRGGVRRDMRHMLEAQKLKEKMRKKRKKTFAYALIKGNDVRECGSFLKT